MTYVIVKGREFPYEKQLEVLADLYAAVILGDAVLTGAVFEAGTITVTAEIQPKEEP